MKRQQKEKAEDAGEARTFCIITHLFHQISQILPRVFANGKKKGKERKNVMQARKESAIKNKIPQGVTEREAPWDSVI